MHKDAPLFAASAVLTALGFRLAASSPFWDWVIGVGATVMILSAVHIAFERFIRPHLKGKKNMDPLLVMAMTAATVTVGAIAIYALRSSPRHDSALPLSNVSQPELVLVPPEKRHEIVWNPRKQYAVLCAPEGQISDSFWSSPIFYLKNLTDTPAQDVTVTWQTEISGVEQLVKSSARLSHYNFGFSKDGLTISGGPTQLIPFTYRSSDIASSQDIQIPFVTNAGNGSQAFIPMNVYATALLYTIALMPDTSGARINPFNFSVTVTWNLPSPGTQRFLIKATIVNAKPPDVSEPEVDALMSFEVAKVE